MRAIRPTIVYHEQGLLPGAMIDSPLNRVNMPIRARRIFLVRNCALIGFCFFFFLLHWLSIQRTGATPTNHTCESENQVAVYTRIYLLRS